MQGQEIHFRFGRVSETTFNVYLILENVEVI